MRIIVRPMFECDRCKAQVELSDLRRFEAQFYYLGEYDMDFYPSKDLCKDCADEIQKVINNTPERKQS